MVTGLIRNTMNEVFRCVYFIYQMAQLVYTHYFNPSHCYEKHVQTAKKMICKFFLIPKKPTKNKNPTPRFGTWEVITTSFGIE